MRANHRGLSRVGLGLAILGAGALVGLGSAGGCARQSEENLGLGAEGARKIDVTLLVRPAELARALSLGGRELDERLGAHRIESTATFQSEPPGRPLETIEEVSRLDSDGRSAWHLVHEVTRGPGAGPGPSQTQGQGMEAILSGGELYLRPRFGTFTHRRPEGLAPCPERRDGCDEPMRLRAIAEGMAADTLGLFAPALTVTPAGRVSEGGRAGLRFELRLAPSPGPRAHEESEARRWRETVKVRSLDGELVFEAGSGALLRARFDASYTFVRDGDQRPMAASISFHQETLPAPAEPIAPPPGAVASPERVRPMLDRQTLLEGLR